MAIKGFDFMLRPDGEILMDFEPHDITTVKDNELKVQLAYNRIKSISMDWFIDNIGADLEELIGQPCKEGVIEYGKSKILNALTVDDLLDTNDIYISAQVIDNVRVIYTVYLKLYKEEVYSPYGLAVEDPFAFEIIAELDLTKGVFIRMGWNPRAGELGHIEYLTPFTDHRKEEKS